MLHNPWFSSKLEKLSFLKGLFIFDCNAAQNASTAWQISCVLVSSEITHYLSRSSFFVLKSFSSPRNITFQLLVSRFCTISMEVQLILWFRPANHTTKAYSIKWFSLIRLLSNLLLIKIRLSLHQIFQTWCYSCPQHALSAGWHTVSTISYIRLCSIRNKTIISKNLVGRTNRALWPFLTCDYTNDSVKKIPLYPILTDTAWDKKPELLHRYPRLLGIFLHIPSKSFKSKSWPFWGYQSTNISDLLVSICSLDWHW